jgi:hypothetical protein
MRLRIPALMRDDDIEVVPDRTARFLAAIDELNAAWRDMPREITPWIDWRSRRVVAQIRRFEAETLSEDQLRDHLKTIGLEPYNPKGNDHG